MPAEDAQSHLLEHDATGELPMSTDDFHYSASDISDGMIQTSSVSIDSSSNSLLDTAAQSPDVQLCQQFVQQTCGCDLANGKPCSDRFSLEHYITLRAQCSFLTHDELDLTLLGTIMSTINMDDSIYDGRHKPAKRTRTTMGFMHQGHEVCKKTFLFLYGIGKKRLTAVKKSYKTNGLETRRHGNTKRLPHNHSHILVAGVVKFLTNYAEQNAILLPGRIPSHKRDDIKLLPSSQSKKVT